MTWLLTLPVAALALALTLWAILRDRHHQRDHQLECELALVAYHARRSHQIGIAIREMGDEAEHLFPPASNGN